MDMDLKVGARIKYRHLLNFNYRLVTDDGEPYVDPTHIAFDSKTIGTTIVVEWVDWKGDVGTKKVKRFKGEVFKVPSEVLKDWWEIIEVEKNSRKSWDSDKFPDDPTAIITDVEFDQYNIHARHSSGLNWRFSYTNTNRYSNHLRLSDITVEGEPQH